MPIQPVHRVSGKVTFRGEPAEGVRVIFVAHQPIEERHFNCEVYTGADGSFQCTTYQEGDGLPAGDYNVWMVWPEEPNDDDRSLEVDRLEGRYSGVPLFQFTVKVGENIAGPYDLK